MNRQNRILIVFDMDGVILDSEPLHELSKIRIFNEYGIAPDVDFSWSIGKPVKVLWERMIPEFKIPSTVDELEQKQFDYIIEEMLETNTKPSVGLYELLEWCKENKFIIALASSSNRYFVDFVLDFLKIKDFFDHTVSGDEVRYKKPDPEIYLKVIRKANAMPKYSFALEDSRMGVKAAVAAGMTCIGYENPTSGEQDLSLSKHIVDSLNQVRTIFEEEYLSYLMLERGG